jgi:outer membrane receptor for ferrienterochelin and colicin
MADEVMQQSAGADKAGGNANLIVKREAKALKGETHERWGLKKASKDGKSEATERVAKPWGWGLLRA